MKEAALGEIDMIIAVIPWPTSVWNMLDADDYWVTQRMVCVAWRTLLIDIGEVLDALEF